jgi:predicted RNA polymerase sigma factor
MRSAYCLCTGSPSTLCSSGIVLSKLHVNIMPLEAAEMSTLFNLMKATNIECDARNYETGITATTTLAFRDQTS